MTNALKFVKSGLVFCVIIFASIPIQAQQFNSDNYLSKPNGVATIILPYRERNSMLMNTFSLFSRWEPSLYSVFAITYDEEFGGNYGGGFEIGLMLFTPPFFKL